MDNETKIRIAIRKGNHDKFQHLLNICSKDELNESGALRTCLLSNHTEKRFSMLKELLEKGVDPDYKEKGFYYTPLEIILDNREKKYNVDEQLKTICLLLPYLSNKPKEIDLIESYGFVDLAKEFNRKLNSGGISKSKEDIEYLLKLPELIKNKDTTAAEDLLSESNIELEFSNSKIADRDTKYIDTNTLYEGGVRQRKQNQEITIGDEVKNRENDLLLSHTKKVIRDDNSGVISKIKELLGW